nr:MAG TPA: hypothetical protein [Caudoviricetes sp.]
MARSHSGSLEILPFFHMVDQEMPQLPGVLGLSLDQKAADLLCARDRELQNIGGSGPVLGPPLEDRVGDGVAVLLPLLLFPGRRLRNDGEEVAHGLQLRRSRPAGLGDAAGPAEDREPAESLSRSQHPAKRHSLSSLKLPLICVHIVVIIGRSPVGHETSGIPGRRNTSHHRCRLFRLVQHPFPPFIPLIQRIGQPADAGIHFIGELHADGLQAFQLCLSPNAVFCKDCRIFFITEGACDGAHVQDRVAQLKPHLVQAALCDLGGIIGIGGHHCSPPSSNPLSSMARFLAAALMAFRPSVTSRRMRASLSVIPAMMTSPSGTVPARTSTTVWSAASEMDRSRSPSSAWMVMFTGASAGADAGAGSRSFAMAMMPIFSIPRGSTTDSAGISSPMKKSRPAKLQGFLAMSFIRPHP